MKYGWQIAAGLLGLVAIWELLKHRNTASSASSLAGTTSQSYVGIVTPANPSGAFASGLSQNPYDPNAIEGT